jgi:hypothetical protein
VAVGSGVEVVTGAAVAAGAGVARVSAGSEDPEHPTSTTAATIAATNPDFINSLILLEGTTLDNSIARDM